MSVIIKGVNAFDMSIVSNIKDVESQYIKFQNIYFKCKSIEDAGGTIFVKRKKGKWHVIKGTGLASCECGHITDRYSIYNFCPVCGAKMER